MTAPLLELRGLGRRYRAGLFGTGAETVALADVSLTLAAGEILALVGESGSGKSTLARLAAGLDRPSHGSVRLDGVELLAPPAAAVRARRRAVQMVFQDPFGSLDPRQRVGTIVAEPLDLERPPLSAAARRARAAAMLAAVGLADADLGRFPHEFSGGQRQRIAIARALVTQPRLLVADEPVSALDLSVQAQILNLLLDSRDRTGLGILFISHDLGVVDAIADRIVVLYAGRVVESASRAHLFEAPAHPYTRLLIAAMPQLRPPGALPGGGRPPSAAASPAEGASLLAAAQGCAFAPRCPRASALCRQERPDLRALRPQHTIACHHPDGPDGSPSTPAG